MANWITITPADLKTGKAAALVEAFASTALGEGQDDPTAEVISNVTHRIRSEVQSSTRNRVSATATAIPPSLKSLAIRMINWELQSRLNFLNAVPMSDQDKEDHRSDERYLERIARGEVTIETPDDPIATPEVQSGGSIEQVSGGSRTATREKMEGM